MKSKKINFIVVFFAIILVSLFVPKDVKEAELTPNLYLGIQEFRQNMGLKTQIEMEMRQILLEQKFGK